MTILRTHPMRTRFWAPLVALFGVLAGGACTNPMAVPDSAVVATHTTSSGNASTSERSRAP